MSQRWSTTVMVGVIALVLAASCSSSGSGAGSTPASTVGVATTTSTPPGCRPPESGEHAVDIDGTERSYLVYSPEEVAEPAPILVLFHGFSSSNDVIAAYTGLDALAPEAGVVLVTPKGQGDPSSWGVIAGFEGDRDFVDKIISELSASPCVDGGNVWLAGNSAGSAFAAVYGCGRAEELQGIVLSAGLAPPICPPDDTPTILIHHGTADLVVPFDGGEQAVNDGAIGLASIPDSAAGWAERAGCAPDADSRRVGDDVEVRTWTACGRGSTVSLHIVEGAGHTWPGALVPNGLGETTQTYSSSCVVLHHMTGAEGDPYELCPGEGGG